MKKERYEQLVDLRSTGELEKDPELFNELFEFERKIPRIVQLWAIDNSTTIDEAIKLIPRFNHEEIVDLAIEHQNDKFSKAAKQYLKEFGSIL